MVAQHISEYDIAVEYASMHRYMMRTRRNYLSILSASHHLIDEATTMRAKKYSSKAQKRLGKKRRFLWSDIVPFSPDSSISREINRLRDPRLVPNNWRGVSRYIRDTKSILGPISVELLNMRVRPKDLGYRYVFSVASGCATRRD
ncbi:MULTISPECIES: hypothetical protein [unclassified Gordonia (in: high G+C Gram-positive bacteria)]|uniref:hypothetical protein n=1 Tax=unclassified Gordonia (in: high G+C Gram-positive bacteria) TaxID=2657482 RepID=UPI00081574E5|nr:MULTISPECIES: hypothetical protein [unclassified Gordonia (in: high G+C Gram-positive bacteria)]SCC55992.1 hypothetical protein GA0061091_1279 [Gordonia sp. v-85]